MTEVTNYMTHRGYCQINNLLFYLESSIIVFGHQSMNILSTAELILSAHSGHWSYLLGLDLI